jgi:O-antigen/teichoic acid export membrane protein
MTEDNPLSASTDRRTLARNAVLNLIGQGVPLIAALVAVPGLLGALGTERFGVLTLAWLVVGYFSLFDFGIGRALTKLVAERLGKESEKDVPNLVGSALALLAGIGIIAAIVLAALSEWLATTALNVSPALQSEAEGALYVLSLTIPFVITTSALRGLLEAQQRFGAVNAIRIPLGIFSFVGPLIVSAYTNQLPAVVSVLAALRIAAWLAHLYFCFRLLPRKGGSYIRLDALYALFRLGTWMTVSNVVGPLMVYLDRFLIGALMSMAAVAYYATPYEIVTKLWLIPAALAGVLFPAFAVHLRDRSPEAGVLFVSGIKWVALTVFPVTLLVVTFAFEGLEAWLGREFAANSVRVLQLLAAGVLVNCVAQIPFTFLQAAGRPDLTAKLHLLELPVYLVAVYWAIRSFGIDGAAVVWLARVTLDLVMLVVLCRAWVSDSGRLTNWILAVVLTAVLLFIGIALGSPVAKVAYVAGTFAVLAAVAWRYALTAGEKRFLRNPWRAAAEAPSPRSSDDIAERF